MADEFGSDITTDPGDNGTGPGERPLMVGIRINIILSINRCEHLINQLDNYEMVIPTLVDDDGNFLSYDVKGSVDNNRRIRRQIHSNTVRQTTGGTIHYQLEAFGKKFHFDLRQNKRLLARNFMIENWNASGLAEKKLVSYQCIYEGFSREPHISKVAISNCHGLQGVFSTEEDDYFVEPLWNHTNSVETMGHPHIVYKRSSLKLPEGHSHCGVRGRLNLQSTHWRHLQRDLFYNGKNKVPRHQKRHYKHKKKQRSRRSVSRVRNVETLVVVDKMMVNYHGKHAIEAYILTVMNIVAKLFHDPSIGNNVNIIVTRLVLLSEDQPNLKLSHHADQSLDSFCRWQKSINTANSNEQGIAHHDNAVLVTRYDICTYKNKPCGTLGLAPVAGMCEDERSCSINEDIGLASAFTIAHEIGHNFGMQHDGAGNKCGSPGSEPARIMAAQLTKQTVPFLWSSCSSTYITDFLDSGKGRCLVNTPPEQDFEFPKQLPGVRHDADKQCRLQFGETSSNCEKEEICRQLWCLNENGVCMTNSIPAAEGTECQFQGRKKGWCYRGECRRLDWQPKVVDGGWGTWREWGTCTRTCGGGVETSSRECDKPTPKDGGQYCTGKRRRYRSCNINPCPENSEDFRISQCNQFNKIAFRGRHYNWVPFSGTHVKPCALNCMAEGYNFYTERARKVIDGTRCYPDKLDMCINGECNHVGCDGVLGSLATEDKCRVCSGDGTTCQTITGMFDRALPKGAYQEVLKIPKGALHIVVKEARTSKNYLALKSEKGDYYINGDWTIDWPRKFSIAGTTFHYERPSEEPEALRALGPTSENLVVMILLQDENLGIQYEYNMPHNNRSSRHDITLFTWRHSAWSQCSNSCGGGTSVSSAVCVHKMEATVMDDSYCSPQPKPGNHLHDYGQWGIGLPAAPPVEVDRRRGPCTVDSTSHNRSRLFWKNQNVLDEKTNNKKECKQTSCPPTWIPDRWSECSQPCGRGERTRHMYCMTSDRQTHLDESHCDGHDKPPLRDVCIIRECPHLNGRLGSGTRVGDHIGTIQSRQTVRGQGFSQYRVDYNFCSSDCGFGHERRIVQCRLYNGDISNQCDDREKPPTTQECESPCLEDHTDDECEDRYQISYCPLVLKFGFCNREYFQKICCKSCLTVAGWGH
ncbi:hypothetical protein ScPMuIL_006163 [Solemya velum]